MSGEVPFSKIGTQPNHELSNRDHLNKEYCILTSKATHSYSAFADVLFSTTSLVGSSLTLGITSIWTPLSPDVEPLDPLTKSLSLLPEPDAEELSLGLDIPYVERRRHKEKGNIYQTHSTTNDTIVSQQANKIAYAQLVPQQENKIAYVE